MERIKTDMFSVVCQYGILRSLVHYVRQTRQIRAFLLTHATRFVNLQLVKGSFMFCVVLQVRYFFRLNLYGSW